MPPNGLSRYRPMFVAVTIIGSGVAALWAKWRLLEFEPIGWPHDHGRAITILFLVGVISALGAGTISVVRWQRALQMFAVICFAGAIVLPIDADRWLPAPTYKYQHEDVRISVRTVPTIERDGDFPVVVLKSAGNADAPVRLFIYPGLVAKVHTDHVMEFALWRTRDVLLPGWRVEGMVPPWHYTLETIRDGDEVLYDARLCPIHHVMMQRLELPIHYGLPALDDAWAEFSGGPGFVSGGCVATPQTTAMGYRCPNCVERYKTWVAERERRWEQRSQSSERSPKQVQ